MIKHFFAVVFFALLGLTNICTAHAFRLRPMATFGYDYGGEKLFTFTYSNSQKRDLRAGTGVLVMGGVSKAYKIFGTDFSTRLNAGLKTSILGGSNGSLYFLRPLLDLGQHYRIPSTSWSFVLGALFHWPLDLKGTNELDFVDYDVSPSWGGYLQAEHSLDALDFKGASIFMRYTKQSYRMAGSSGIDAQTLGLGLTYMF